MRGACASIAIVISMGCAACGGGGSGGPDGGGGDDDPPADAGTGDTVLADDYPGDVGLGADPAVIWFEPFDAGSVGEVTARYDQAQGQARMELVTDQPAGASGTQALAMTAGQGTDAVDLFKQLQDHDEWWVRWYVKYQADVPWHHSGMWFGGYNPSMPYPSPQAGLRPDGDDRVSFSIEPVWYEASGPRFDFYNYWRGMHTWQEPITDPNTAYYGNALIHQNAFTIDEDQWVCLEVHIRLNTDPGSAAGALVEVWKGDAPVIRFDENGPMGYWIRDKFCPIGSDGTECTDYPAPFDEILDLQFRTTDQLALNAFWPQNYITDDAMGTLVFDQMVVATERIGCLR